MQVRFLLDTCILSETSKRKPDRRVVRWIARTTHVAVPMGAWVEFEQGIEMKRESDPPRFAELSKWRNDLICTGIRFVDTDFRVAIQYGRMRACRELKNLWYPDPKREIQKGGQDIHIAAAAIINGYCIATGNVSDFLLIHEHFPLPGLFDPTTFTWHVRPSGPSPDGPSLTP